MKKKVYGYIRVSDQKQVDGASLSEQKRAITEYAIKNDLHICQWFEETQTAAKRGRPQFDTMIYSLKKGDADGAIIHKIDRSARNLYDWASIGDLTDHGIDVHFAHESLDMNERGGRLSADIQAVMASDYVRNLRQETIKGLYGRLEQGIYPFAAPVGYIDAGKGNLKEIDPIQSDLVKQTFELYLTEEYNVRNLADKMFRLGLRNKRGNKVTKDGLLLILKNPFYKGLMRVKGKLYKGHHQPLIDSETFSKIQQTIAGRKTSKGLKHNYLFRRKVYCKICKLCMSGEFQKGVVYYRCHTRDCKTKTVREDWFEKFYRDELLKLRLHPSEKDLLRQYLSKDQKESKQTQNQAVHTINVQLAELKSRKARLLDTFLENLLSKMDFQEKKNQIIEKILMLEERKKHLLQNSEQVFIEFKEFLELCIDPVKPYDSANTAQRRIFADMMTSNFNVSGKSVDFKMVLPFDAVANRQNFQSSVHSHEITRKMTSNNVRTDINTSPILCPPLNKENLKHLYDCLLEFFTNNNALKFDE